MGSLVGNLRLNLGSPPMDKLPYLLSASQQRNEANFSKATELFSNCASDLEDDKSFFWAAISRENEAKSKLNIVQEKSGLFKEAKRAFLAAAKNYGFEAEIYEKNKCYLLAERAKSDKLWCENQARSLVS